MINGLSKYSKNGVKSAISYLLAMSYNDKSRNPPPALLAGNTDIIAKICASSPFVHKYTSGVLSFSMEESNTIDSKPGLKETIINEFENFAFSGFDEGSRCYLMVEHRHAGRLELHYVIPRVNLVTGKYFNPFPPGFKRQNDAFVDFICAKHKLTNPRDPSVARSIRVGKFDNSASVKHTIHRFVVERIKAGSVYDSKSLRDLLMSQGLMIVRDGRDYISVKVPGRDKALRLKGDIYGKHFKYTTNIDSSGSNPSTEPGHEVCRRYKKVIAARTCYHLRRYKQARLNNLAMTVPADKGYEQLEEKARYIETAFKRYVWQRSKDPTVTSPSTILKNLSPTCTTDQMLQTLSQSLDSALVIAMRSVFNSLVSIFSSDDYARSSEIPSIVLDEFKILINKADLLIHSHQAEDVKYHAPGYLLHTKRRHGNERSNIATSKSKNTIETKSFSR